jgi:hypothetical protein
MSEFEDTISRAGPSRAVRKMLELLPQLPSAKWEVSLMAPVALILNRISKGSGETHGKRPRI